MKKKGNKMNVKIKKKNDIAMLKEMRRQKKRTTKKIQSKRKPKNKTKNKHIKPVHPIKQ
jgi:ribosomal protein L44E